MTFKIEFQVVCQTRYGQQAVVCGNLPELGNWSCKNGLNLATDQKSFPLWKSSRPIFVRQNTTIEFKLCIVTSASQLVKWEQVGPNRIFTPKSSLIIHFTESQVGLMCKVPRKKPSSVALGVENVRKGTEEVINDLASDSSSNRQIWREHRFNEQQESSLLLSQFADNLKKAVGTQRQQMISPLQPQPEMQLQSQLQIGDFEHQTSKTHYIITQINSRENNFHYAITQNQSILLVSPTYINQLQIRKKDEISAFHFFAIPNQKLNQSIEQLKQRWTALTASSLKGALVFYSAEENVSNIQNLIDQGIDIVVCSQPLAAKQIAKYASNQKYRLKSSGKDEFIVFDGSKFLLKVVLYGFLQSNFLDHIEISIKKLDSLLFKGFYFKYSKRQIRKQLRNALIQLRSTKNECLIVLQIKKVDELSVKSIAEILELSSLQYEVVVIILTQQKFPRNMDSKIPAIKNRLLILNTQGEIYSNGKQSIDLFDYLQVNKAKFIESQKLISQKIGKGLLTKRNSGNLRMNIQFQDDAFGRMLKERAFRCIRDINKKSLAKVIPEQRNNVLELIPFVLHPAFLLKVALGTFTSRLRNDQKGLVISIESQGFHETKWMQEPEGRQINLEFCRFCLSEDEGKRYGCASLDQTQLNELFDVIVQLQEEKKNKGQANQLIFDHSKSLW